MSKTADLIVLLETCRRKNRWFFWASVLWIAAWSTAYATPPESLNGLSFVLAVAALITAALAEFVIGEASR